MNLLSKLFNLLSAAPNADLVSDTAEIASKSLEWHPKDALGVLPYMGKGMLVIFVIIAVIIIATMLINKVFSKTKKDN